MLGVDEIGKIRQGLSIKGISRDLGVPRTTVRKVLRSGATEFICERRRQPRPKIGAFGSRSLKGFLADTTLWAMHTYPKDH